MRTAYRSRVPSWRCRPTAREARVTRGDEGGEHALGFSALVGAALGAGLVAIALHHVVVNVALQARRSVPLVMRFVRQRRV